MRAGAAAAAVQVCCVTLAWILICTHCHHHTAKRALLLYPPPFVLQLTCCLAVPGTIPNRTLAMNMCVQSNFNALSNVSQLSPLLIPARAVRSAPSGPRFDRTTLYTYMVKLMDQFGLNGQDCLLRSICEAAEVPMDRSGRNTILEKILHYILTPSDDQYKINQNSTSIPNELKKYYRAEYLGRTYKNCKRQYQYCTLSLLDLVTIKLF